jgi:dihydroorotate dehydrogenase electron transfer subunit
MDKSEVVKVLENRPETKDVKTIRLDKTLSVRAGQYVMLWIPEVGEKPFSLSKVGKNVEITYDVKGKFTKALFSLNPGDLIGVRGPYGNGWSPRGKRICAVAGGIGLAPMMPLIEAGKAKFTVIYGAKNVDYLVFRKRLEKTKTSVVFTTDDGSFGKKCFACDALIGVLGAGKYDMVLTCGPEAMMKKVADICKSMKMPCQVSLERYMKCGIGLCGSCAIDPKGLRVCKDGPMFWAKDLVDSEFGSYNRGKSGSKQKF